MQLGAGPVGFGQSAILQSNFGLLAAELVGDRGEEVHKERDRWKLDANIGYLLAISVGRWGSASLSFIKDLGGNNNT